MTTAITLFTAITSGLEPIENVDIFMPYMSYKCITDKTSNQYKLQQKASTDMYGFRLVNNRYMVALYYPKYKVGDTAILKIKNTEIPIIVGDVREDEYLKNTVEFIVDTSILPETIKISGNCLTAIMDAHLENIECHYYDTLLDDIISIVCQGDRKYRLEKLCLQPSERMFFKKHIGYITNYLRKFGVCIYDEDDSFFYFSQLKYTYI